LYAPVLFLLFISSIIYGISLIFSVSGERGWLKIAGIFTLALSATLLLSGVATLMPDFRANTKITFQDIMDWASAASALAPVFILANFVDEIKNLKPSPNLTKLRPVVENILNWTALLSFVFSVFFGITLFGQSRSAWDWQKQNAAFARESSRNYEAGFVISASGDTLKYQFMKPLDYDPQQKYPLVLCLHHGGTHGNDNIAQLGSDPAPFLVDRRQKYPAFYLMPQCPKSVGWNSIDASVMDMINALEDEFQIDDTRRYVLGISGGGYGSWHFITAHPEMFAAAVPICGGGDPELASKISNVPVWAFHGEDDNLVPVRSSREMIEGMKKAGGNPKYTEFPDAGHNIWNQVSATDGLMDWIFAQKRRSL
jgi:pimeloyl-ACP methyl ester carboxylesterase